MRVFRVSRSIYSLAYTPDSLRLWVGDGSGRVHLCDLNAATTRPVFPVSPGVHTAAVYNLSASADGRFLSASSYGRVTMITVGPPVEAVDLPPANEFPSALRATLSPNGQLLAVSDPGGNVALWDRVAQTVRPIGSPRSFAVALSFSPDSRRLVVGSRGASLSVYDPHTGEQEGPQIQIGHPEVIAFSPNGGLLAVAGGNEVALWEVASWRELRAFRAGQAFVRRLAFHPKGRLLATAGDVATLSLWDLEGRSRGRFDWEIGKVQAVAFAPDGMTAAAGGSGGKVAVWDVEDGPG
jgi:WD40 repeat protein